MTISALKNAMIVNGSSILSRLEAGFETEQQEKLFDADAQHHFNSVVSFFHVPLTMALSVAGAKVIIDQFPSPTVTPDEVLVRGEFVYIPYPVKVAENVDLSDEESDEDSLPRTLDEVIVDDCNYLKANYISTDLDGEFKHAQEEEFEEGVDPTYSHVVYYCISKNYLPYLKANEEAPRWMAIANEDIELVDAKTGESVKPVKTTSNTEDLNKNSTGVVTPTPVNGTKIIPDIDSEPSVVNFTSVNEDTTDEDNSKSETNTVTSTLNTETVNKVSGETSQQTPLKNTKPEKKK